MSLLSLPRGIHAGIHIQPRWPARQVQVDARVIARLSTIQAQLPSAATLILTRGYEPPMSRLGAARTGFRALGIFLFRLFYPGRHAEIADIFGSNGHDTDGSHIDISVMQDGHRIRLLPLGVFTPRSWQLRRVRLHAHLLSIVREALAQQGFLIHHNATESLQIHCDLNLPQGA
ncbi:hypothetical protein [Massilia sp. YIM B04103]|uniref:hypothetical protein n=1 Tax=Massilia sp. YIM B04103 TaxID=2963106 RepID=UPI00210CE5F2|nr:hypothetical protein [Massilia sp. YIM B04103]